jgi:hypothetical protein
MGLMVSVFLTALAAVASLVVVVRIRVEGRAEAVVAGTLLWTLLIAVPIYALGLADRLTAGTLALSSSLLSMAVVATAARGRDGRAFATELGATIVGIARMPGEALRIVFRGRSPVLPGLVAAGLLFAYMILAAYLAPEIGYWDALWYHQSIVGFTIQNHGFAVVELPDTLQKVNGYPRLGEMTQLWFTIFAGRRLLDVANLPFVPALAAGGYLLARRVSGSVCTAVGCGAALVLFPAVGRIMQSSYVDVQNAALLLGGVVFATRVPLRLRDGLLAAVGLALAVGSKALSLAPVAVTAVIVAVRLLRAHGRDHRRATWGAIVGGAAVIGVALASIYLRNYLHFHNPLWPDLSVDVPALHIHWPGLVPWSPDPKNPAAWHLNVNEPVPDLIGQLLALPSSVKGPNFDQTVDYGAGVGWVVLPLGLVGAVVATWVWARTLFARRRGVTAPVAGFPPPMLLLPVLVSILVQSPALWCPRYHVVAVAVMITLIAWLGTRGWERAIEAAVGAFLLLSLISVYWVPAPHWMPGPERLVELARRSPAEREVTNELGAPVNTAVGIKRNQELGPGSVLVFNERYAGFPSVFWNDAFSNRIVYVKGDAGFLARAAALGATWIFLTDRDPALPAARAAASGWQEIGVLNAVNGGRAFRRVR